ncbi:MAG: hypothetical protein JO163_14585 [Methylobacteriaceae bacterium]|nr:hypothetical protein [Methylobacteriaceae bacterium]
MHGIGLTSPMITRLNVALAALISVPAVMSVVSVNSDRASSALRAMPVSMQGRPNPFGELSPAVATPYRLGPMSSRGGFDLMWLGFENMTRGPLPMRGNLTEIPQLRATKSAEPPRLPIGCEPLGGTASALSKMAGRCLAELEGTRG